MLTLPSKVLRNTLIFSKNLDFIRSKLNTGVEREKTEQEKQSRREVARNQKREGERARKRNSKSKWYWKKVMSKQEERERNQDKWRNREIESKWDRERKTENKKDVNTLSDRER